MNSYPVELLIQHAPLMFVAGLDASPSSTPPAIPVNGDALQSPTLGHERRDSINQEMARDPFLVLISRLRTSFSARRRGAIWDLNKSRHFNVLLVDKAIKFPPRKVVPLHANGQADGPIATQTPRSPLSPLNPTSPLYPDGIIAPVWVRKHTELVPCVFVLFTRLWESPPPASPLEGVNNGDREEERRRDAELAMEIGARKKSTSERGIKLTVVLMASRRMLDDPNLDARLSFIRRQSGLDARAALFVLSPLSSAELNDFIESLQEALFESAVEYYASHSKRVRRKKGRFPLQATPIPPGSGPITGRPLRSEGWVVRYEYKMATFAEFRMEEELARKHYEDCWEALMDMFSSVAILPPRTKRWAEARVLADSVSFKICKLHMYQSEFSRTIAHFNRHVRRLTELSRLWGIGQDSFEFWSWIARQYRLFAELLEHATRAGIQLPVSTGFPTNAKNAPDHSHAPSSSIASFDQNGAVFGLNPANSIHHAGYYYFAAASCTQQRYRCYNLASQREDPSSTSSPALANERKIDHQSIILELYSKAYEIFKAQSVMNDRMTFYVAYRIAETYYNDGKYDLGAKFFERIAKTYRREQWGRMLKPILSMWCECARQSGDVEATVPLLLEMMGMPSLSEEDRSSYEEEVVEILKTTSPSIPRVVLDTSISHIFVSSVAFWESSVFVGETAPFQVTISALPGALHHLAFSTIHLFWDDQQPPIIIEHTEDAESDSIVDLGEIQRRTVEGKNQETLVTSPVRASLRWATASPRIFAGTITSSIPAKIQFSRVTFFLKQKDWEIEIPMSLSKEHLSSVPARWATSAKQPFTFIPIRHLEPSTCVTAFRPHVFSTRFQHSDPAYLNERFAIDVELTNQDDQDLEFVVDVLMQPTADESVNEMVMETEISTSLIKGMPFGTIKPGETAHRTLFLHSTGSPGERVLDFSIQSRTLPDPSAPIDSPLNVNETLHTLSIPTVAPFQLSTEVLFARDPTSFPALLDMSRYDDGFFHRRCIATVVAKIACNGPWNSSIESIRLVPKHMDYVHLASSSLSMLHDEFPLDCEPSDEINVICEVHIAELDDRPSPDEYQFPGVLEVHWRRTSSIETTTRAKTTFTLPTLHPPGDDVIGLLYCQPSARLHEPFPLHLTVQNRHPLRTADIQLDVDSSEAFVLAGPRHAKLTTLLPGTSEQVSYRLMPLLTGVVKLPTFRLQDRRKALGTALHASDADGGEGTAGEPVGRPVQIVMVSRDARASAGAEPLESVENPHVHTISVYPY